VLRPSGADSGAADEDPMTWRVSADPVGLEVDANILGLNVEGDDLAEELRAGLFD
jgi:hypothetical protein